MIGPKCQLCGKSRKYHGAVHQLCPAGKRRKCRVTGEILYDDSHPTNKFTPKPPKKRETPLRKVNPNGSEKRKDRAQRRAVKSNPCAACFTAGSDFNPIDPAHLRTFKVTQSDHPQACIALCRLCHRYQHSAGWGEFFTVYPHVADLVQSMGWEITPDPFSKTRVILSHKEIA